MAPRSIAMNLAENETEELFYFIDKKRYVGIRKPTVNCKYRYVGTIQIFQCVTAIHLQSTSHTSITYLLKFHKGVIKKNALIKF